MKLTLPSGRRVSLEERGERCPGVESALERAGAGAIAVGELALADYNALRAVLMRLGWLGEEEIEISCRNCGELLRCRPCATFALGPLIDGELHDPELDATLRFGVPHPIPRVRLLGGREARDVTFEPRTVAEAAPLHAALARPRLAITSAVVRAMGIARLGEETRAPRVARALTSATEEAWSAVCERFLESHYPPRLFAIVSCPGCGARNDVDAPFDREFEPASAGLSRGDTARSNADPFPSFDEFDAAARVLAEKVLEDRHDGASARSAARSTPAPGVTFVVEGGVAACDDGGEPLLGAYLPGDPGDARSPSRAPEITVFFRTFRAIHDEEGPYDWRAELEETLAHELDHHVAALVGEDRVDDEERREIADEVARVHGKSALARAELRAFGADIAGFLARTWPIWLIVLVAVLLATLSEVR